jgi:hypothetical protein
MPDVASLEPFPYVEAGMVEPLCVRFVGMPPGMPDAVQSIALVLLKIPCHNWEE